MNLHDKMLVVVGSAFIRHHIRKTLFGVLLNNFLKLRFVVVLRIFASERLCDKRQNETARRLNAAV